MFYPPVKFGWMNISINTTKCREDTNFNVYEMNGFSSVNFYWGCAKLDGVNLRIYNIASEMEASVEQERNFYEDLYYRSLGKVKSYSINHNILTFYESNSPRLMIFVRNESSIH